MDLSKLFIVNLRVSLAILRMTVNEFLTEEVRGITPEQAREYLTAFVSGADDSKILTAYYLVRATTDPSKK